jgi:hypothetical protein
MHFHPEMAVVERSQQIAGTWVVGSKGTVVTEKMDSGDGPFAAGMFEGE